MLLLVLIDGIFSAERFNMLVDGMRWQPALLNFALLWRGRNGWLWRWAYHVLKLKSINLLLKGKPDSLLVNNIFLDCSLLQRVFLGILKFQLVTVLSAQAPVLGEKPVAVKGLERTGRDFDPEPLGQQTQSSWHHSAIRVYDGFLGHWWRWFCAWSATS